MSLTPWLPTVKTIKDGETVEQATVNPVIYQLTQREQHLYEKFEEMSGKSVLISFNQPIHPNETISADELSLVYFKSDDLGAGIAKCITGFTSSTSSSMYSPSNSNYVFGLIKRYYSQTNTVDLFTEGLCELEIDIDDATYGLLQKNGNSVEPFRVGPYYLSRKSPGKITSDPAGIPVYVGYAITKRLFLLHTNVDEFSQFFINYRYHLLDLVAGTPVLANNTWSINNTDLTQVGWISAAAAIAAGKIAPTGAKFFYNLPTVAQISADSRLTAAQKEEAQELKAQLPPVPANFVQLFVDGTLVRYNDSLDTAGYYSINNYGVWWHTEENGKQPWTQAGSTKNVFLAFAKFNPALRTQLVSSLAPYNLSSNRSDNFIQLVSKDNTSIGASTGDLLLKVIAPVNKLGFNAPSFTYPTTQTSEYTAGRAIANFEYSPADGAFKAAVTPVVARLEGANDISVTPQLDNAGNPTGVWTVSYLSDSVTGQVDSIEPINTRLEFRGLSSYLKLPIPSSTPYGMIGKIVLPKGYPNNQKLSLIFMLFGDAAYGATATARKVALNLEYSVVSMKNGATESSYTNVNMNTFSPTVNPVEFSMTAPSTAYSQYDAVKIVHADLAIPASYIREDSVVNFKIMRVATASSTDSYLGNVGLLGTYWSISNN